MNLDHRIDKIVEIYIPSIKNGQETIDSIIENYPQYANALRPRLEAVLWLLNAKKNVEPRPGFITSSRQYMQQRFENIRPHGFWQRLFMRRTPQRWVFNIAAPVIVLLLMALIINSAFLTARLSIPGDPFYSTKLVIEDIQLAFTFDQVDKTDLSIQFSRERTTEFVELVLEGDYELLPPAANRLETEIIASLHSISEVPIRDQVKEQPMIVELRETLTNEIFMLNMLKSTSPTTAYSGIELAIQVAQSGLMALR
jgi:hypothetical protein